MKDTVFWNLKDGLIGLRKQMPDSAVRWAIENGYGWPRHYEPPRDPPCPHCQGTGKAK